MKRAAWLAIVAASAAVAAVGTIGAADHGATDYSAGLVQLRVEKSASTMGATLMSYDSAAVQPSWCTALASSAGAITSPTDGSPCGLPSRVSLQDRVYFGAMWQILDRDPAMQSLVLGGGYASARVIRSNDGKFFAGLVDKTDAQGRVSDVILAFAGADGGFDAVQGEAILLGLPLDEAARAAALYEQLLAEPRYAEARIHVTGHSLGAGYTQYVLAHALAAHGAAATDQRADFLAFGAPNWVGSAAAHLGVDPTAVAQRMADFTALNDPVLVNGVFRLGINTYLPAFTGLTGLDAPLNVIAAHWPTTYASALGLPDWLSAADRKRAMQAVSALFNTGNAIDLAYGPPGTLPLRVDGSAGPEWLVGLAGTDRLIGWSGADVLTGGPGADDFVYKGRSDSGTTRDAADRIADFSSVQGDRIDLAALAGPIGGLRFVGAGEFTGPGQVRTTVSGSETQVTINLDLDPAPDMLIRLDGRFALKQGDFVLGGSLL